VVDRYQITVAAVALVAGVLVAGIDVWARSVARPDAVTTRLLARSWATAGLAGALIGGWQSPRSTLWWIAAVAVVVPGDGDGDRRPHPLGRSVPVLALIGLVGVWSAMPDTEPAVAIAFALAPLTALTALTLLHRGRGQVVGPAGTAALVVGVLGAAWVGSAGRVVGVAAIGTVAVLAFAPAVLGWRVLRPGPGRTALIAAQAAAGLVLPRAVMQRSVPTTILATLVVTMALMCVVVLVRRDLDER